MCLCSVPLLFYVNTCTHLEASPYLVLADIIGKRETERDMIIFVYLNTIIIAIKFSVPNTCSHPKIKIERRIYEPKGMKEENSLLHTHNTHKCLLVS